MKEFYLFARISGKGDRGFERLYLDVKLLSKSVDPGPSDVYSYNLMCLVLSGDQQFRKCVIRYMCLEGQWTSHEVIIYRFSQLLVNCKFIEERELSFTSCLVLLFCLFFWFVCKSSLF